MSRRQPKAIILAYHRIGTYRADPWALSVSPSHFAEHLRVVAEAGRPLSLTDLAKAAEQGEVPDRGMVITFDDGYANNVDVASPMLHKLGIPATFFMPTALIGQAREFWWDLLVRILLEERTLPDELVLAIGGELCCWQIGRASDADMADLTAWRAWEPPSGSRQTAHAEIWKRLHPASDRERHSVMETLVNWARLTPESRADYRTMSWQDVSALAMNRNMKIGSHSKDHVSLATLPQDAQHEQLLESRLALERVVGYPVSTLSYPFGQRTDFNSATTAAARGAGYRLACTAVPGVVLNETDLLQLPRFHVTDWDAQEFARRIHRWLGN